MNRNLQTVKWNFESQVKMAKLIGVFKLIKINTIVSFDHFV